MSALVESAVGSKITGRRIPEIIRSRSLRDNGQVSGKELVSDDRLHLANSRTVARPTPAEAPVITMISGRFVMLINGAIRVP